MKKFKDEKNLKRGKGLTFVEVLISSAIAALFLLILTLTTININKMSFSLSKKYEISSKSKIFLNKIVKELVKNQPPSYNRSPILRIEPNLVEFYSYRSSSFLITLVRIAVYSNNANNGVSYRIEKVEIDVQNNNIIERSVNNFFIETTDSEFRFENMQNVAIRIYLRNAFLARGKRYEIYQKIDVPINY
ncbi:MAG: hypothetical protein ACK4GJ_00885 [bacterium]